MAFSKIGGAYTSFLQLSVIECNESSEIDGTCEKAPCPLEKSQSITHSLDQSFIYSLQSSSYMPALCRVLKIVLPHVKHGMCRDRGS